jgi:tripartite ATP-independent transporter DctP family solute receptor
MWRTALVGLGLLGALAFGGAAQAKTTFTLSTPDPDGASITEAAKKFAAVIADKSKGEIEVKVFPNGTLYSGDPSAAVKQLGAGSLDMLLLSTSLYANFNPKFTAISIPFLFDDTKQLLAYLNSDLGAELSADLAKINIRTLAYWHRPFRQITNSKRPITSPADMSGLRFRVPSNPLWVEFFKAVGAAPVPMAFGEVYTALQMGVVDGQENPVNIPVAAKFYEVQKYVSMTGHMADGWVVGINQGKFAALSPDLQKVVAEAAREMQDWVVKFEDDQATKDIEFLKGKGMQINNLTPEQQQQFVAVAKKLFPVFEGLVKDKAFFAKTLKFVGKN